MMKDSLGRKNQIAMVSVYGKRGFLLRLFYLIFALCWYALTLGGRIGRCFLIVLYYHGIPAAMRDKFDWQIQKLSKWKFSASFTDRKCLEGIHKSIYVTFDDAFANLLDNALPVLEQNQVSATIFAVADNLGRLPRWEIPDGHPESTEMIMTAEQLVAVSENPLILIGSHTLTHTDLAKIRPDQLKTELIDSKRRLEQLLHKPIEDLALPYGSYNQEVLSMAQEAGYKRIYTVDTKPINSMSEDAVIGRFCMSPNVWKIEFLLTCAGAYTWLYPCRQFVRFIRQRIDYILDG